MIMDKKILSSLLAFSFGCGMVYAQTAEIGTWAGFRKGAASFTFDDGPQSDLDVAAPAFDKYGYKATFNIVVNWANGGSNGMLNWSGVQKLADGGHEIASHSNSHPQNMNGEEASSKNTIASKIKQKYGVITVAYPNCNVPDVNTLKQNYIAGRICGNGQEVMGKDGPGDWFKVPAYMTGNTGSYNNTNAFTGAMQQAVQKNGWVMFLTHGFDNASNGYATYSPTNSSAITGALQWANQNDKDIWIAPMGYVAMYIKERNGSKAEASSSGSTITVKLTHNIKQSGVSDFDFPLSLRVKTDLSQATVKQANALLESKIEGGYVYFDAVPNAGDITISGDGGSDPIPESSSSVEIPQTSSSNTPVSSSSRNNPWGQSSSSATNPWGPNPWGPQSSSTTALTAETVDFSAVAVYKTSDNYIEVSGAQGLPITVYNNLGQVIRTTRGLGLVQKVYTGAKGMYLVKVGSRTFKVSL